jgi:hypothetical protein
LVLIARARTAVEVAGLPKDSLLEIDAVAWGRTNQDRPETVMPPIKALAIVGRIWHD